MVYIYFTHSVYNCSVSHTLIHLWRAATIKYRPPQIDLKKKKNVIFNLILIKKCWCGAPTNRIK